MDHFDQTLLKIVKESISERGFDKSLIDTIANQFEIERTQTEASCVLSALIDLLLEKGVIDESEFNAKVEQRLEEQQNLIKEAVQQAIEADKTSADAPKA